MKCPYCTHGESEVVETRDNDDLTVTRRRRQCIKCEKRFTTYERVEGNPLIVIKKDGRRESFDPEKIKKGLLRAGEKTTVTHKEIETIVDEVERELRGSDTIEIQSKKIGRLVAARLKKKDKIAYIRFSSVFQQFMDLEDFEKELKKLS